MFIIHVILLDFYKGKDLEPNHTHFLLADDATNGTGAEVKLRSELEKAIAANWDGNNDKGKLGLGC